MKRFIVPALVLVMLLSSSAGAQTSTKGLVTVRLPRDARLYVDDVFCPLPGEVRSFETTPLEPGKKYFYTLKVAINVDGKPVTHSMRAVVQAATTTEIDFGDRAAIIKAARAAATMDKVKDDPSPPETGGAKDEPTEPGSESPRLVKAGMAAGFVVWKEKAQVVKKVAKEVKTKDKDGKEIVKTVYEDVYAMYEIDRRIDPAKAVIKTVGGKAVSLDELKKRLATPTPVLVSRDGQPIAAFHLQLFDDDVLTIVAPPEITAGPAPQPKKS